MNKVKKWFIGDYLEKTDDVFEKARIELVFAYSMFFLVLGIIFYINLIVHHLWLHVYVISIAVVSLSSVVLILKYKQNVRLAANWYVIQQFTVSISEMMLQNCRLNVAGGLFSISSVLFIFFIYGRRRGALISLPFILMFCLSVANEVSGYTLIHFDIQGQQLNDQPILNLMPFALNVFAIYKFMQVRSKAEAKIQSHQEEIELKNKEITDSIVYAQRIQKAILPSHRIVESYLPHSFVVFLPKDIVSGDFYWTEKKGDKVFFAVADCTGHGVPGAMVSVIGQNALNRVVNEFGFTEPAKILDKLNDLVEEAFAKSGSDVRDGMDIALCAYDARTMTLEYAGAHNPLYHITGNELKEYKASKQPIGRFETKIPFANNVIQVNKGDCVYVFSDGIADQFGGKDGKKFKYKRVKELLQSVSAGSHMEQKNSIISTFSEWKMKHEQVDDVCVFGVKF